jgi:secreted Zn-dependent insulinase-like peptidase
MVHPVFPCLFWFGVQVSITLTDLGLERWQDVVTVVFQYIAMLKAVGPQEWVFQELRDASLMEYNFGQEAEPVDQAVDLATTMAVGVPAEDILNCARVSCLKPSCPEDEVVLVVCPPAQMRLSRNGSRKSSRSSCT